MYQHGGFSFVEGDCVVLTKSKFAISAVVHVLPAGRKLPQHVDNKGMGLVTMCTELEEQVGTVTCDCAGLASASMQPRCSLRVRVISN